MQKVDKPQPRTNINKAKLTVHVYTVDRAWLALKVTCKKSFPSAYLATVAMVLVSARF